MPHKNGLCPKCGWGLKHHRWIEQDTKSWDEFHRGQYWKRELKCPNCGYVGLDWKMRTFRELELIGLPTPDKYSDVHRYERSQAEFEAWVRDSKQG